jgi:hypothetical protein
MFRLKKYLLAFDRTYCLLRMMVLVALILGLTLPRPVLATPGTWTLTGPMQSVRYGHTATLLPNGQVLVTGGSTTFASPLHPLASAELYNPASQSFSPTDDMRSARLGHTATLLPNGRVLVTGGTSTGDNEHNSAELYTFGLFWGFSPTDDMGAARAYHTATLLPDGKVLMAGGRHGTGVLNLSELYDPATGLFTATTGHMKVARAYHTATLLPNGTVLVAGGKSSPDNGTNDNDLASAELYNPATGTWSLIDPPAPTSNDTAILLRTGKVLVLGSYFQLYAPATGTWSTLLEQGIAGTANLLFSGKVLIPHLYGAMLYDPAAADLESSLSPTGSLNVSRIPTTVRLNDGKVLAMGGLGYGGVLSSAELYDPELFARAKLPPLLAFYPFEGNAIDMSGNGRHGTLNGTPTPVAHGFEGQAYSFNGTADYITIPLDISPGTYPRLTMGCWARTHAAWPPNQAVLSHDNGGFDRYLGIDYRGGGIGWSAFSGTGQVLGAVPPVLNAWTFLAVSYDQQAQTVRFQVDDMVFTKAGVTLGPGLTDLTIGASPPFNVFFDGIIDNVFLFGDVLTDQQLAYIRNGGARAILIAARKNLPGLPLVLLD